MRMLCAALIVSLGLSRPIPAAGIQGAAAPSTLRSNPTEPRTWIKIDLTNKKVKSLDLEDLRNVPGVLQVIAFDPGNTLIACVTESGADNLTRLVKLIDQGVIQEKREVVRITGSNFKLEVAPAENKKLRISANSIASAGSQFQISGKVQIVIEGPQDFKVTLTADSVTVETVKEPKSEGSS